MNKYRYIWLPALLLSYGLAMAAHFGPELIAAGRLWQVWTVVGADIVVCILLFIFLRKKQRMQN
jgi:hypothetical protein